jgi:hypothetical protein
MTALPSIIESLRPKRQESSSAETTPQEFPLSYLDPGAGFPVPALSCVFCWENSLGRPMPNDRFRRL